MPIISSLFLSGCFFVLIMDHIFQLLELLVIQQCFLNTLHSKYYITEYLHSASFFNKHY